METAEFQQARLVPRACQGCPCQGGCAGRRALLGNIDEDDFGAPTPCPNARVGDLIDHVGSLSGAFTEVAVEGSLRLLERTGDGIG